MHHYGYEFPVAIDANWRTLNRWWIGGHPNGEFTSVSFLLDRNGVIRRVHLGGLIDAKSGLGSTASPSPYIRHHSVTY